ncbi:MAG: addiction module protein [Bacteroidota bacterium]
MAELINKILALPRSEKWHILAVLAEELRKEEQEGEPPIPDWQIDLASQALKEVEDGKVQTLSDEEFWKEIDAKVEQFESQAD